MQTIIMKTGLRVGFTIIFSCTLFFACTHKITCSDSNIYLAYKAFSQQDLDTIIMRRYVKGSNFAQLKDTALFNTLNYQAITASDTIQFALPAGMQVSQDSINLTLLTPDYDYGIYIPALNRLIQISKIIEEKTEGNAGGVFAQDPQPCYNPIQSYIYNGQTISGGTDLYNLIITK